MAINVKSYRSLIDGAKSANVYFDPSSKKAQSAKSSEPASKSKFEMVKDSLKDVERGHGRRTSSQAEVPMPSVFKRA